MFFLFHEKGRVMSILHKFIEALFSSVPSLRETKQDYLAEAVDIYDLERRMREIDARGRGSSEWPTVGVW